MNFMITSFLQSLSRFFPALCGFTDPQSRPQGSILPDPFPTSPISPSTSAISPKFWRTFFSFSDAFSSACQTLSVSVESGAQQRTTKANRVEYANDETSTWASPGILCFKAFRVGGWGSNRSLFIPYCFGFVSKAVKNCALAHPNQGWWSGAVVVAQIKTYFMEKNVRIAEGHPLIFFIEKKRRMVKKSLALLMEKWYTYLGSGGNVLPSSLAWRGISHSL